MKTLKIITGAFLLIFTLPVFAVDCPALAGEFTIGKSEASDFASITDAMHALQCGGVSAPVTFFIESNTYNERVIVSSITGVSSFNPVRFESKSGKSTDVVISYPAGDATLVVNSPWVSFENITVDHKYGTYGSSMRVDGKASNLHFKGVVFNGIESTVKGNMNAAVYFTSTAPKSDIVFEDCEINNGTTGIWKSGMSAEVPDSKTTITGTLFYNQLESGLALMNEDAPVISDNVVNTLSTDEDYMAVKLDNVMNNMIINRNIINTVHSAVGLMMNNCEAQATAPGQINNNSISVHGSRETFGIFISGSTANQVFNFNRVKMSMNPFEASTQAYYRNLASGQNINMLNNIFMDMNSGVYTVIGNSYKDFFNVLPTQSNKELSSSANSISMEKVTATE